MSVMFCSSLSVLLFISFFHSVIFDSSFCINDHFSSTICSTNASESGCCICVRLGGKMLGGCSGGCK